MLPEYWNQATQDLTTRDPVLKTLILTYTGLTLVSRGDAYSTLARSIVGQQISVKAAESVWKKLISYIQEPSPSTIASADSTSLRSCGLSGRKVEYLQELARNFLNGEVNAASWHEMEDELLIRELVKIKGIGRWTAEMFMIFHFLRPNVLPLDDIGLQRAISLHYKQGQPISRLEIQELAKIWEPWRSVATWYLWRSLDPVPVEY